MSIIWWNKIISQHNKRRQLTHEKKRYKDIIIMYPTRQQLKEIKFWSTADVFGLLDYIEGIVWGRDFAIKRYWGKDDISGKDDVLYWEFHTGGWSGNELIIDTLIARSDFKVLFWHSWRRGGHYYMQIDPRAVGYKKINDFLEQHGISRQLVWRDRHRFDVLRVSKKKSYVRWKR